MQKKAATTGDKTGKSGFHNVQKVYNMLTPKPKQLLENPKRTLVRHGELIFFSTNTMSTKPRYFFLFNDCLLITKRTGQAKFLLRLWMYLKSGVQLYSMPESPNYEFRLLVPVQGTVKEAKKRRLIIYAKSEEQKEQWVNDLAHLLWACTGKKGPDPSKNNKGKVVSVGLDADERAEEEEEDRKKGYVKKPEKPAAASSSSSHEKSSKEKEEERKRREAEQRQREADEAARRAKEEQEDAKEYSSDDDEAALDESGGASLIDLDSISDSGPTHDIRGLDSTGRAIPKGVQLGAVDGGSPGSAGGAAGAGAPGGYGAYGAGGYQWPPGTVIDPATGFPVGMHPGAYGFPPGVPIDPKTGLPVGYVMPAGYAMAGAAGGAGVGGVGGVGAMGIDLANPSDPNLSLLGVTKDVSAAVRDLIQTKKEDTENQKKSDGVNLDDLAQKELREATDTIEAITKQLMARPRKAADKPPDAEITMDDVSDAILNATQAIAKAAGALLKAATAAQAERLKAGIESGGSDKYNSDPLWSEGLISAAHYVVATTQNLVSTADSAINGQAKEETLVASAKAVSAATAQLVAAQRAKSTAGSGSTQNLEDSARGITKATAQLVQIAAQFTSTQMQEQKKPDMTVATKYTLTEQQRMKLEKQAKILELEKQAEQARKELLQMNESSYKH